MNFNLTEGLEYDNGKEFRNQEESVKEFINEIIQTEGYFVMDIDDRMLVSEHGSFTENQTRTVSNCTTIFDVWARPIELSITKDTYIINIVRDYIEKSTTWRMRKEFITLIPV